MSHLSIKKDLATKTPSSKIVVNMFWMALSGTASIASSVLLWIFLARMRETEELGRFTIVMGLYALFFGVCSLGLVPYLVSEITRRKELGENSDTSQKDQSINELVSSASVFLLFTGIFCAILMATGGFLVSESWSVRISTLILSLAMIPTGVINVGEATAIAFGQTRLIAFASSIENGLKTIIPFALIWFGFDISLICASLVIIRFSTLLFYLWTARHKLPRFSFNATDFIQVLKVSPTFGSTIVLASINWQAVIILLGYFSTESESAKYGAASRFLIPVTILMASYTSVIQPNITQFLQKSYENAGSYLSKIAGYPLVLSTLAAILSPFLSHQVLTTFFGSSYADASQTLDILALSVVPFCIVMIAARGLIATNSQHVDLFANALGVFVCLTLGAILIPKYGATGAAIAQLCSFLSMALVETIYLSRKIIGFRVWRKAGLSSVSLLIIYLIIWKF